MDRTTVLLRRIGSVSADIFLNCRRGRRTPDVLRSERMVALSCAQEETIALSDSIDVVVIGAGQAGLAVSHELVRAGVADTVLEQETGKEVDLAVIPWMSCRVPFGRRSAIGPRTWRDLTFSLLEKQFSRSN